MESAFGFTNFDESDDVFRHSMHKPKTMNNNCVNLQCLNNRQKLIELKSKYDSLEQKYFQLEDSETKKCEEYNDLLHKKENELKTLKKYNDLYSLHNIKNLDYSELKNLEAKITNLLDNIKKAKAAKLKNSEFLFMDKKTCIACMSNEITTLFKPCNHLCVCDSCCDKLHSCPMCRSLIKYKVKVKFPY